MEHARRPSTIESREDALIQKLASEASRLVRAKEAISIPIAIRMVLQANGGHRADLYTKIASELGARGARKKALGRENQNTIRRTQQEMFDEDEQTLQEIRHRDMLRDARAHELRQPKDTYYSSENDDSENAS